MSVCQIILCAVLSFLLKFRFRPLAKQKSPGFDHRAFVLSFTVSVYLLFYAFTKIPKHSVRAKERLIPLCYLICVFVDHFLPAFSLLLVQRYDRLIHITKLFIKKYFSSFRKHNDTNGFRM